MSTKTQSGDFFAKISAKKAVSSKTSSRSKVIPGYLAPLRRTKSGDTSKPVTLASDPTAFAMRFVASPCALPTSTHTSPGLGASRARRRNVSVERASRTTSVKPLNVPGSRASRASSPVGGAPPPPLRARSPGSGTRWNA